MAKESFYVTTPIYYGTAKPHLGSLYSTLIADVIARWQQLLGKDTYFLTGTDEYGQKVAQAAEKAGVPPQQFVDSFIKSYKDTWQLYDIAYNQFIRTTDLKHRKGVEAFIEKLLKQGDIYKGSYDGWYCTPCESYVTAVNKAAPLCPSCGRETVRVSEESYFFKLSAYQEKLLQFYKDNPDFIAPKERMNEVISFVESGLKDLSVSRASITWGIPFPHDPGHVAYVWVDALCNYITAIGYGNPREEKEFHHWWPANAQVMGKDIVRFHAVYWLALLMAADLKLPKRQVVHGWIQINKQKMSKSRGNVVDPVELANLYGAEQVRYYLMRQLPINSDGEFSTGDLEQRITSDLANDLGNLLHRMVSLADQFGRHAVEPPKIWQQPALDLRDEGWNTIEDYKRYMDDYEFHLALARLWQFINKVNAYFHEQEPWKVAKKDPHAFQEILSATCHSLRIIALLLWPVMPKKMMELLESLGHAIDIKTASIESLELGAWHQTFLLKKGPPLFEKIEESKMTETNKESAIESEKNYIKIDDLIKVDLRVGTIKQAESVPGADKLIKLQVDLGDLGIRQVISGIRKWYHPEDLVGKQGIFVANLKPRKIFGHESQGMMLFAEGADGKYHIVNPEGMVPNGMRLR